MDENEQTDLISRILGDYARRVSDAVVTRPFAGRPGGPGGRHRARTRRRVLTGAVAAAVVAGIVAVLVAYGPRSSDTGPGTGVTGHPVTTVPPAPLRVRSLTFTGSFQPTEEVDAGGALWLVDESGLSTGSGGCRAGRIDPGSLKLGTAFALQACGMNVVAGGSALYLETEVSQRDSNNVEIGIERFSISTHVSTVFSSVVMTVMGSAIAHTQLAYADGWLWLYGKDDEVVQISPTSGDVVRTISGMPGTGGTEPLVSAGPGGVWLAGGAGASSAVAVVPVAGTADTTARTVSPAAGAPFATVDWLAPVGGRMWAGEATETSGASSQPGGTPAERIVVLSPSGGVVQRSPVEEYGQSPVEAAGDLFTVGPGATCGSQPIWRVDPSSLRTSLVTTLHPPFNPCLAGGFRSVAGAGGAVFVLDGTGGPDGAVLYRVTP